MQVLNSLGSYLPRVRYVEAEMSLATLYEGQSLMWDVASYLCGAEFDLSSYKPEFVDPRNGRVLQADGIFVRRA